jgi:hypothetical protein
VIIRTTFWVLAACRKQKRGLSDESVHPGT